MFYLYIMSVEIFTQVNLNKSWGLIVWTISKLRQLHDYFDRDLIELLL